MVKQELQAVMKSEDYKKALRIIRDHGEDCKKYEDRDVLERIIIPSILSDKNPQKILDVGREEYEQFYNLFFKGRELWTIDIDPERKVFGSKNHIVDNVKNVTDHFNESHFDLIIMNGVFGWGLNDKADIEMTISGFHKILGDGGIFVFGFNDIPDLKPVEIEEIESLKMFDSLYFKPLDGTKFKSKNGEHTYMFFVKNEKKEDKERARRNPIHT